jgi:hypothetical protein
MGYELEASFRQLPRLRAGQRDVLSPHERWLAAQRRLVDADSHCRALRGVLSPGEPVWLGAQLQLAQARLRCRELADALADDEAFEAG